MGTTVLGAEGRGGGGGSGFGASTSSESEGSPSVPDERGSAGSPRKSASSSGCLAPRSASLPSWLKSGGDIR